MNKRKNENPLNDLQATPEKRRHSVDFNNTSNPCSQEEKSDVLNSSFDMFDEEDGFDDYMMSLPDAVLCGSQPLPDISSCSLLSEELPDHIMETIFSCLPIIDMCSCSSVCKRWNEIISNPQFMPGKLLYHKVRFHDSKTLKTVKLMMEINQILTPEVAMIVTNLIKSMTFLSEIRLTDSEIKLLNNKLEKHRNFEIANKLLIEKKIGLDESLDDSVSKFWMLCSTITLLSSEVYEVFLLFKAMSDVLKLPLVLDFFYYLALYCWMLYKNKLLSQEYHYRIFCVISKIENVSTPLPITESCGSDTRLTHEQVRVVAHDFKPGDLVRVMAYAGTGKTSTLTACVKSKPHLKFLYTSFSKAVVDQGKEVFMFTPNVTCATIHSLAYRGMQMNNYRHKLSRGSLRNHYIQEILKLSPENSKFSRQVLYTLSNFMASATYGLRMCHVPRRVKVKEKTEIGEAWVWEDISEEDREFILGLTKRFWSQCADLENTNCQMIDDCYVKQWQMSMPEIAGYDVILLDEAQDCSECMRDVIEKQQQHCALVFVGDSHQQIYGFRKARDALVRITPTHTYYLTQSFRFGARIAQVADCILREFKYREGENIADKTLLGVGPPGTLDGTKHSSKCAILCRTNLGVIQQVVLKLKNEKGVKTGVVGGTEKLQLDVLLEIYALAYKLDGNARKKLGLRYYPSKAFQRYKNIKQMEEEAELNDEQEISSKLTIVKNYGNHLPEVIKQLKNNTLDWKDADVIVSTVHKAKGLEFETVLLCDDFATNLIKQVHNSSLPERMKEDANLLYVATTRATRSLILSPTLHCLLKFARIHFYRSSLTSKSVGENITFCVHCKQMVDNTTTLTFLQPSIEKLQASGPICPRCFNVLNPVWGYLLGSPEQIESGGIQDRLLYGVQNPSPPLRP